MGDLYVPLIDWYPTLYWKWVREGRRLPVPTEQRTGYTVHHTAGGLGEPTRSYGRFVAAWHYQRWSRPGGYSFLIGWHDGEILEMCGWGHVGAHAPGANRNTIGVAFQGSFDSMLPNAKQRASFARLVAAGPVPNRQQGHRDASSTSCPGDRLYRALPLDVKDDDMTPDQDRLLREVHRQLTTGRDAPSASNSATVRTRVWQSNAALGRLEASLGRSTAELSDDDVKAMARQVAEALDERTAKAVADELARRLRD
jgi:hypothetical protein